MKETLTYDSRDMRFHGVDSDGKPVIIDADNLAEDRQRLEAEGQSYDDAISHVTDPDNWASDMAGWIPAGE